MLKIIQSIFLTLLLLAGTGAVCAQRVPVAVVNFDNQTWPNPNDKKFSEEQVKDNIVKAVQALKINNSFQWQVDASENNKLIASVKVRNKHTIRVVISYTSATYSIDYLDSVQMNAREVYGVVFIHPFYNRWAGDLATAIRTQLTQM